MPQFFERWSVKKLFFILVLLLSLNGVAHASCDKAAAQSIIQDIVSQGIATREDTGITIFYNWRLNWSQMPREQQYKIAAGLGGAEHCLREGVAVRIRAAGKEVARSQLGETKLFK